MEDVANEKLMTSGCISTTRSIIVRPDLYRGPQVGSLQKIWKRSGVNTRTHFARAGVARDEPAATEVGARPFRFVSASEDGMSDYNCIDVIREAQATVVAAAQSSTSFVPPLGREKARVFALNLRNRLIFKAADEEGG